MEEDLDFSLNEGWPQFFFKWKITLIFENGRRPQFFVNGRQQQKQYEKIMQPETFQIKTMVVAPLWVS